MSLQDKIHNLLAEERGVPVSNSGDSEFPLQGGSKPKPKTQDSEENKPKAHKGKDKSVPTSEAGDTEFPKQGNSKVETPIESGYDAGIVAQQHLTGDGSVPVSNQGDSDFPSQGNSKKRPKYNVKKFTKEDLDVDIKAIFGESVEDEIKDKAAIVFESAVISRVNLAMEEVVEALESDYTSRLDEEMSLTEEQLDAYMNYLAEEFMERNTVAIETGLRESIISNFISGLHDLFEEHYIEVPEGKANVIDALEEQVTSLKAELNTVLNENIELKSARTQSNQNSVIEEVCEGMTALDKERFSKLINGIDFVNEDTYREKLNVIKESHIKTVKEHHKPSVALDSGTGVLVDNNINEYAKLIQKSFSRR